MTTHKLLFTFPAKSGIPNHLMMLIENIIRKPIPGWDIDFMGEGAQSALAIARTLLANAAIKRNYDRTIQLDTDHPVTVQQVERLLSHDHEKYDIVSSLYCMKKPGKPFWLGIAVKGATVDPLTDLVEAEFLPTGMLSISVSALRKIAAAHPDTECIVQDNDLLPPSPGVEDTAPKETMHALFPIGPNGPRTPQARMRRVKEAMKTILDKGISRCTRSDMIAALEGVQNAITSQGSAGFYCGEDYSFSFLARSAGIKLWLDTRNLIPHEGKIAYPLVDPSVVAEKWDPVPELRGDTGNW